jgi:hypothetical protein
MFEELGQNLLNQADGGSELIGASAQRSTKATRSTLIHSDFLPFSRIGVSELLGQFYRPRYSRYCCSSTPADRASTSFDTLC